ncbi:Uncharacterized protein TCM_027386 [Theobroma cacao]|uniref:RNase H type-1 domain-containing protein n=1 Tax=Theobroma cacao TaxID=3641 RepID=A0A061GG28_THECC|nr:Uncharacterized protein TCM_027386 [Theobroma cacao]
MLPFVLFAMLNLRPLLISSSLARLLRTSGCTIAAFGGLAGFTQEIKRKVISKWMRPPPGSYKLNVDSFAFGKPRLAGMEGAIRDHEGFIKGVFSTPIGIEDSNYLEFLAIKEGLFFFFSSP